ncbi:hypothetical protein PILCRDRAFT_748517 [Piloderma croceum F 1598]|uniref:Uncharacterized protein n=1 Tax=Piloderma croceum (strain F 1598) TaxID=765440 RepID=A0A0C3EUX6_PILCF|nr:hypothetical protein PILCRDRAFT_748517 [Piloderma croceum F 1598]
MFRNPQYLSYFPRPFVAIQGNAPKNHLRKPLHSLRRPFSSIQWCTSLNNDR